MKKKEWPSCRMLERWKKKATVCTHLLYTPRILETKVGPRDTALLSSMSIIGTLRGVAFSETREEQVLAKKILIFKMYAMKVSSLCFGYDPQCGCP